MRVKPGSGLLKEVIEDTSLILMEFGTCIYVSRSCFCPHLHLRRIWKQSEDLPYWNERWAMQEVKEKEDQENEREEKGMSVKRRE
jgi:hypothetical protein